MRRVLSILLAPVLLQAPSMMAQEPSPVGVWEIVELVNWSESGEATRPYGDDPLGYFVYTPDGHLILHITANPPLPAAKLPPSVDELATWAQSSIAYFGTYTVDRESGVITHEIVGDLFPNRVGTSQVRPYRVEGDELILDFTASSGRRFVRKLRRVERLQN